MCVPTFRLTNYANSPTAPPPIPNFYLQMLARLGYSVKLCSSSGGTLRSIKHSFLTAARPTPYGGEPRSATAACSPPAATCRRLSGRVAPAPRCPCAAVQYLTRLPAVQASNPPPSRPSPPAGEPTVWVIDPAFAQAFQVVSPTPRYAFLLSAVPALLVAPLPRVLRAVLLLGAELARCFEAKDLPLPPWRHADALATRYDTATSAEVRPDGVAVPAPSAASSAAPSAAARKQQRDAEQRERVQLRLLKLGVPASAIAAAGAELSEPRSPPTPEAAAGRQPASSRSSLDEAIDSPRSVVQVCAAGCRVDVPAGVWRMALQCGRLRSLWRRVGGVCQRWCLQAQQSSTTTTHPAPPPSSICCAGGGAGRPVARLRHRWPRPRVRLLGHGKQSRPAASAARAALQPAAAPSGLRRLHCVSAPLRRPLAARLAGPAPPLALQPKAAAAPCTARYLPSLLYATRHLACPPKPLCLYALPIHTCSYLNESLLMPTLLLARFRGCSPCSTLTSFVVQQLQQCPFIPAMARALADATPFINERLTRQL